MKPIKFENPNVVLQVNLEGGACFDFHLKDLPLNPVSWKMEDPELPPFMGHFLCFDRWGLPSDAEAKNGFPPHGEVNHQTWKLLSGSPEGIPLTRGEMRCHLPMGGLELTRKIELAAEEPLFFVTEAVKNCNKYGRMFNLVQHVSLGPPFLDRSTLFDNNTEKGFEDKEDGSLHQEEPVLKWPEADHNGERVSLRQFLGKWPRVASFVFDPDEKYAWVTAANPGKNLMLGYLWKVEEYPWVNFWRLMEKDVPKAFGMEFGTTGLHEPFPVIAKKGKIFGRNLYDFIDADEILRKSFIGFLAKIPDDYQGVDRIDVQPSHFTVREKNGQSRDITYQLKHKL